jgi:hypothetical protein
MFIHVNVVFQFSVLLHKVLKNLKLRRDVLLVHLLSSGVQSFEDGFVRARRTERAVEDIEIELSVRSIVDL